ncbi:molecular chaperone [Pseudodonghicola sp. IC7]|uniref:Molecular chaperone n=1 Tax=Pseudodonghicola flavimaris TaxID=3050036 RepID=A0ABT7EYB7_9RHOB|nr:molecular chaperone [Pseudodonghicola flavimaris]
MAEGLRVTPVLMQVVAPGAQGTLTLRNTGRRALTVQVRVFRWEQQGGTERLVSTREVVVSPPITQVRPGTEQSVRVVRTVKSRVRREEAYRVLVDEVPDRSRQRSGTVDFATRLSLPVFFVPQGSRPAAVSWSLRRQGGQSYLEARNSGEHRLRLVDLQLQQGGRAIYRKRGLFGYVLAGASMRWPLGTLRAGGGTLKLTAKTDAGNYNATVAAR